MAYIWTEGLYQNQNGIYMDRGVIPESKWHIYMDRGIIPEPEWHVYTDKGIISESESHIICLMV